MIAIVLEYVAYCYWLLHWLPWYYSSHFIFHTSSSDHLGVACIHPSISTYLTRSSDPSLLSVPESLLPALTLYPLLVPTEWISLPVAYDSVLPAKILPGSPKVVYLTPPGPTMPLSCKNPLRIPPCLDILQILVAKRPTTTRLPIVYLCRSLPTTFLPLPALLPSPESTTSCPLAVTLIYMWYLAENTCVLFRPSAPLPPKVPRSPLQKLGPLVPPNCIILRTPWVPPLPVSAVSPTSPRLTLRAWCFTLLLVNHNL